MFVKQISVFLANVNGRLADVIDIVSQSGVDIRALALADTADYGVLRMIVNKPDTAITALRKASVTVRETLVLAAQLPDKPGAMNNLLRIIGQSNEPIMYTYAFISPVDAGACVILRTPNNEKVGKVLIENGIRLLSSEELDK